MAMGKRETGVGQVYLIVNVIQFSAYAALFGAPVVIYSLISTFLSSFAVDHFHFQNINVEVKIITKRKDELADAILRGLGRGVTEWSSVGAYTDEPSEVLYVIISKYEITRLKNIIRRCDPNAFVVFGAVFNVHRSWMTLRWHILGIELKRQLNELVCGDESKGDNPYSYSRYWKERANSVQRLAVLRCRFAFQTRHYIFDVDDECDKVGLAATEGDSVWCIYLPSGCMYQYDLGQLEAIKDCGAFGKFYPESERDKWLEQVRPLAKELHEDMDGE